MKYYTKYAAGLLLAFTTARALAQTGNWNDYRADRFADCSNALKTIAIQNEAEMALLAYSLNNGEYNDYTVSLLRDIDMTAHWLTPIGDSEAHAFRGTFDGKGHLLTIKIEDKGAFAALFRTAAGATLQHLRIAGSVKGGIHSAGLVGHTLDNTTNMVSDCLVSVNVNCSDNGISAPHGGGIIGHAEKAANTVIGCFYNGTITATDTKVKGDKRAGAIIGWSNAPTKQTITDCVEQGDYKGFNVLNILPVYGQSQPKLTRVSHRRSDINQGRCLRLIKCDEEYYTISIKSFDKTYETSTLEISNDVVRVGGNLYSFDNCTVDYELIPLLEDYQMTRIYANNAHNDGHTLKLGTGSDYTLRAMVFNAKKPLEGIGSEEEPYLIHNDLEWNYFCNQLDQGNTYAGKYLRLEGDFLARYMAGTEQTPFCGSFDGNGDKRQLEIGIGNADDPYTGLFRYVKDAEIKYFYVHGSVYSNQKYTGGLIGRAGGRTTVRNCRVSVSIKSGFSGTADNGGIVAVAKTSNPDVTIRSCRFDGALDGHGATGWGGILGLKEEGTANIQRCLYAPAAMQVGPKDNENFGRNLTEDAINEGVNYYTYPFDTSRQGKDGSTFTAGFLVESLSTSDWEQLNGNGDPVPVLGIRGIPLEIKSSADLRSLARKKEIRAVNVNFGEMLHNDGHFNTICLPFSLVFLNVVIADGAELYQFANAHQDNGTDKLVFARTNTIQAGTPYLVRWTGKTSYTDRSHIWFTGVTISTERPLTIKHGNYIFCGTFDDISKRQASEEGIYVMGGDDNWHPVVASTSDERMVGAFRAFLRINGGNGARVVVCLEDSDGTVAAIIPISMQSSAAHDAASRLGWYTLDGQRLLSKPTAKGIYIHHGTKFVIK